MTTSPGVATPSLPAPELVSRLVRWNVESNDLELLSADLSVALTLPMPDGFKFPLDVSGPYLVAPSDNGATTTVDFTTGVVAEVAIGGPGYEVSTQTPSSSPWRLVSTWGGGDLVALNVTTSEVISLSETYGVDPQFYSATVVGSVAVGSTISYSPGKAERHTAVRIDFNGSSINHQLIEGGVAEFGPGFELRSVRRIKPGSILADGIDYELWRDGAQVGDAYGSTNGPSVRMIDRTSMFVADDGKLRVHNFATGQSETVGTYDPTISVDVISPTLAFLSSSNVGPAELFNRTTGVRADVGDISSLWLLGPQCYQLEVGLQYHGIVRVDTGDTLAETTAPVIYAPDPQECTLWFNGDQPGLVVRGERIDVGDATTITDVSVDGLQALVVASAGPAIIDIESGTVTSLPPGEYRFVETLS